MKNRAFVFLPIEVLSDNKLTIIASEDALHLGIVSSFVHLVWFDRRKALLENRAVYVKTECFDPFPFPTPDEAQREIIRDLAEQLDAHRKKVLAEHQDLTMTGLYNVLEKLKAGEALSAKEKSIHERWSR